MANELRLYDVSGLTVTARVRNVATGTASSVSCAETVDSGGMSFYLGNFPAVAAGTYDVGFSDGTNPIGATTIPWDGTKVVDELDAIKAKTDLIKATSVTVVGPVNTKGQIELQRGDDYYAADNRAIAIDFTGLPDLTTATVVLNAYAVHGRCQAFSISGNVTNPSSNPTISFDVPKATTAALTAGGPGYEYDVVITLANGHVFTPQSGDLIVTE